MVRDTQKELDLLIQEGVARLTRLLINSETKVSSGTGKVVEGEEKLQNILQRPYLHQSKTTE